MEHRALAAPRRPEDGDELARLDPKVEAPEGDRLRGAGAKDAKDVAKLECAPGDLLLALGLPVEAPYLHLKLSIMSR